MKINIVGAGFAGLATAYFLAKAGHEITVFYSPAEKGASSIAAGLVHPFAGAHSKLNWRGREAFQAAEELFKVAGDSCLQRGVFRLALSEKQVHDFKKNADKFFENEWRESHDLTGVTQAPGLWMPHAYTIHAGNYLAGLTEACRSLGVTFKEEHLSELPAAPVVVASGSSITKWFPECKVTLIKGQLLRLKWPTDLPPLPYALNSKAYIVMDEDLESCWVGSTFEKDFSTAAPDIGKAINEIMPKATEIIPALAQSPILDCQAGIRVATPNHLPLIKELKPGCWVFTGLGSKGLLYHALLAKELVIKLSASSY